MDVLCAPEVVPVGTLASSRQLGLRKGKGHIKEERQRGARNRKFLKLGVQNPIHQFVAFLLTVHLGTLVANVGVDIAVADDTLAILHPTADKFGRVGPITRIEECHKVGVNLLHRPEFAPQEACNQVAIDGCIKPWKVEVLTLPTRLFHHLSQEFYLCRFTGSIQAFQYYKHTFEIEN